MKVEYINPIVEASKNVINQITGFNPSLGRIYKKTIPYSVDSVMVLIGLTGQIQGSVNISLNKGLALKIVSAMMGGMEVNELDEIAKSAISELCNMILGNAATIFYSNNISIDITPPIIMTGTNIEVSQANSVVISIPLNFENGDKLELDISYKEK
ncbi:chemotaxis protein CheX [Clostridium sp. YIM B02505]|uniref:Chemotaxis protein CheX n=1 Tax=Clostridium yunnanense TaxID=2800325 RepID=A0ABS1EJ48_9CLOT|nr:chemotaxis protein CheX [Clostridium yunnanense]MBK1809393.1 chemotaxis protein CheX [Clostridium yunnanense]